MRTKEAKHKVIALAKRKYFLKHSTRITRETRVRDTVILKVIKHYKNGLSNADIARKTSNSQHIVKAIVKRFTFFRKPVKDLDLMLPKKVFQPYNKHGIVSCFCGKMHPIEQLCIETINSHRTNK
jgi:hypothetical protein